MAQPIDFSSEGSIPSIAASAFLTIPAWESAGERFEKLVRPLDSMLQSRGIGKVKSVEDKFESSEHFLTGAITYSDLIAVSLANFRADFRRFEAALKEMGITGSIYYVLADGRDAMSSVRAAC
jgi:hypothetical protein